MSDERHEHEWYPLAYTQSESGEDEGNREVSLWACAGRTRTGRCLAIRNQAEVAAEERKRQRAEANERAEQEQRHWNWEK